MNRIDVTLTIIFLLACSGLMGQQGSKYIRHYNRKEYKSQPQNWSIRQDRRGFIYVANQGSVLEYDGHSWGEIQIPGKNVRSLALAENDTGQIYVGGNNEIGVLTPNATGPPRYTSLTPALAKEHRQFGHVWRTWWTDRGVYFCASKFIFLVNGEHIKVWCADTSFSPPLLCGGELYVRQKRVGLSVIRNGKLQALTWGDLFKTESIYMLARLKSGALLAGVRKKGFLLVNNGTPTSVESKDLQLAASANIRHGVPLHDNTIALATVKGGVFIFDTKGKLIRRFNAGNGLEDNNVSHIFQDREGNLWLAQVNRIAKIEYSSPFSFFNTAQKLPGMVMSVCRHEADKRLYAGTDGGLYILDNSGVSAPRFSSVPGIPGICYDLFSTGEALLAATDKGIFAISGESSEPVKLTGDPAFVFFQGKSGRWPLLAGTANGLALLSGNGSNPGKINHSIRTIAEDKEGRLWLGSLKESVTIISGPVNPIISRVNIPLPEAGESHVYFAANHIMVATGIGIFRWDEKKSALVPDLTLGETFAGGKTGRGVKLIRQDYAGRIWFHSKARNLLAVPRPGGGYQIHEKMFLRIPFNAVNQIYSDPHEAFVWLASADGLIQVNRDANFEVSTPFAVYVREVSANETVIAANDPDPVLPFERRSLRFTFAAPFYQSEDKTLYRSRLRGYDREWTAWSSENRKDYTNLESGLNVFRVQAKNVYGDISREASFHFRLLPPWYRTWWAYMLYVLALLVSILLIVHWRSRKLEKEKQNLERIIHQRTREIEDKNFLLRDQSEKLKELDTLKSRFFANISHEFRTPLTLIMGPLEQMLAQCGDNETEKKQRLELMIRNAQRLLRLINQLLDLSKLDGGKLKLRAVKTNIISFLKTITSSFELLPQRDNIKLEFLTGEALENLEIYIDPPRMEDVLSNLLINAFKFTPAGGHITVSAEMDVSKAGKELVKITVQDTGPGIPERELDKVFDRFFQADGTYKTQQKGTGIGLALARELVELHHGELSASSIEGEGSCFTIYLPLGSDHLSEEEMVDEPLLPKRHKGSLSVSARAAGEGDDVAEEPMAGEEADEETEETKPKEIILVVEDNADVRSYIRGNLDPLYKVEEAADGAEGLRRARGIIPDLVISDVMMPEMDGYELCAALKGDKATSHIPVILLTAKASEDSVVEGLDTGADDYVTKPFSTAILLARIKNLIELRRHLQLTLHRELTGSPVQLEVSSIDQEFLTDLKQVIEVNIEDPDFNVEALCNKLYMSRPTVYRKIQALSGESPTEFIRSFRLNRAAELLSRNFGSVLEVALEVGFSSANYFTKCFKKKFNQLPSTYQAQ